MNTEQIIADLQATRDRMTPENWCSDGSTGWNAMGYPTMCVLVHIQDTLRAQHVMNSSQRYLDAGRALAEHIPGKETADYFQVGFYNDHPRTTFADIQNLIDKTLADLGRPVSVTIAIVAHPKRRAMAHRLSKQTGGEIVLDSLSLGAKANHLQAWEYLGGQRGNWGVVLEDDVVLCEDFYNNLCGAIKNAPTPVLSLYLGRGRPPQYQERIASIITRDVSFITADALFSAQGYAMPINYFSAPIIKQLAEIDLPIDESITQWVRFWHGKVSYPKYSLVDHRDGPTLIADHGDGQPRNQTTALCVENCDPSGARLPEIRKAWLTAGHNIPWGLGSIPLPEGETHE